MKGVVCMLWSVVCCGEFDVTGRVWCDVDRICSVLWRKLKESKRLQLFVLYTNHKSHPHPHLHPHTYTHTHTCTHAHTHPHTHTPTHPHTHTLHFPGPLLYLVVIQL